MKVVSVVLLGMVLSFSVPGQVPLMAPADSVRRLSENYRYTEAIQLADLFLEDDTTNVELLKLKAKALQAYFRYQESIEVYERIYREDTTQLNALNDLVNANRMIGQYDQAAIYCKKILLLFPDNLFFRTQLANLYYLEGKFAKALDELNALYWADTLNLYVIRQIGNSFASLGKVDSAIAYYQRALVLDSVDVPSTVKLSNQYILKKAYDTAFMVTERFLQVDSTNSAITKQNGYCCYLLRNYEKARTQFIRSIELGDRSKFAFKYLGLSYYKRDEFALAEPWFRQAYYTDTTDAEVSFYYGVCATRALNPDTGLLMLNKTLASLIPFTTFLSTVYVQLAETYNELNDADTALALLIKASEQNPSDVKLLFRIGYQYDFYLKNEEMALIYYEDYLNKSGSSEPSATDTLLSFVVSFKDYATVRISEIKGIMPDKKGLPGEPDNPVE